MIPTVGTGLLLVVLLLGGCTTPSRTDPPDVRMHSSTTADATVACLVRALDAQSPGRPLTGPPIPHHAVLIVPGQVYEVTPSRPLNLIADQNYTVRVTAEDGGAAMELRAMYGWVDELQSSVEQCGEVVRK